MLFTALGFSQIYVSANSYVYVNDTYVYATGNVNLNATTSNIYLRKDGQFLQGTTAFGGSNQGNGALSVYQEGTVNNYQYNYWCSPVGGSSAGGNQPFGITQLGVPSTNLDPRSFTAATILPMSNYNGASSNGALSVAPYWIWKFIARNAYDLGGPTGWIYVGSATTLNAGEGFTMKGTSGTDTFLPYTGASQNRSAISTALASGDQRYDFRGIPNDGSMNVAMVLGNQTLTGNPYPSAIDLQALLIANGPTSGGGTNVCDGTALFWEHDKTVNSHNVGAYRGGYGVYNGATNTYTPATYYNYNGDGTQGGVFSTPNNSFQRKFAPIGQGFMVRCTAVAGNVSGNFVHRNTYRVFRREGAVNNSEFQRISGNSGAVVTDFYEDIPNLQGIDYTQISKTPAPQIRINALLNSQAVRQIALVFIDSAVEGYDAADSQSADVGSNLPYDMYLSLANSEFVHSANKFNLANKYPIGFKCNAKGTFKIKVSEFVNFNGVDNVYLHNKETNEYFDIKNGEYEVSLPAGVNNTKYEITFQSNTLNTISNNADSFDIYQNNVNTLLTIKNPNLIDVASVTLFDVQGKTVLNKKELEVNEVYEFNTNNLSQGIYIVKLVTKSNQEITKKVAITNKK